MIDLNWKKHSLYDSFNCAIRGVIQAVKMERNLRIHLLSAALAIGLGVILDLSRLEFVVLFITIG
ncbi:MAG TPA: diacylglycerol kinase family protein, partial [Bacillota bacterium]|nr:diacylglycerol kinase family protein [Bacillota bacterium]